MTITETELRGIQEVADSLGITPRTLRFYEDKGLIEPQRVGTARIYTRRETGRMQLILRGKRLGFSLREIKEFLDLYDADPQRAEQLRRLVERCRERTGHLEAQLEALDRTLAEIKLIEEEAMAKLAKLTKKSRTGRP